MRFRLATWNINSVRLRLDLVSRFARREKPDVLCLQEIKCIEGKFPELELRALGFPHIAVAGQKGYHGVAILSRLPFTLLERRDICGRGHARHLSVKLAEANETGARSFCTTFTSRPAATCPIPSSMKSSATSLIFSKQWISGFAICVENARTA